MKAIIELGLRNPYLVAVTVLVILVVGVTSASKIPADLLPQFDTPAVQIVTFYPGMAPEVMERDITSRLERWTGQSVGIEHQEAKSLLGVSIVKDFFQENITLDTAMSQVTSYAMSDQFYLPPGTLPPMVMPFDPTASVPLCLVTVSSPTMNEKDLYDVAYFELRNRLQDSLEKLVRKQPGNRVLNLKYYFLKTIRNQFVDDCRKNGLVLWEELNEDNVLVSLEWKSLEDLTAERQQVEHIMAHLLPGEREILYLFSVEGLTADEIADYLESPRGTVLSKISRLRAKVKKQMARVERSRKIS